MEDNKGKNQGRPIPLGLGRPRVAVVKLTSSIIFEDPQTETYHLRFFANEEAKKRWFQEYQSEDDYRSIAFKKAGHGEIYATLKAFPLENSNANLATISQDDDGGWIISYKLTNQPVLNCFSDITDKEFFDYFRATYNSSNPTMDIRLFSKHPYNRTNNYNPQIDSIRLQCEVC